MKAFWIRWFANAAVLLLAAGAINGEVAANAPGDPFMVQGFVPALGAVVMITIANLLLQPLAKLITVVGCVFNVLTLGLLGLVTSFAFYAIAFYIAGTLDFLGGFQVANFTTACQAALVMAISNAILGPLLDPDDPDKRERRDERRR